MKRLFFLFFGIFFWSKLVFGQAIEPQKLLLKQLRTQVFEGNILVFRDLGSLLEKSEVNREVRQIFQDVCWFPPSFWNPKSDSKRAFFDFFYKNQSQLFFDDLTDTWQLQSVDNQSVIAQIRPIENYQNPEILVKKCRENLLTAVARIDTFAILTALENLTLTHLPESESAIFVGAKKLDNRFSPEIFGWFAGALATKPTDDAVELIIKWAKNGWLDGSLAEYALETIFNHYFGTNVPEILADRVRFWHDSLGTLEAIRQQGFDAECATEPIFFDEEVDYWGRILSFSGNLPWVRKNAIGQLVEMHAPRALYYLSTQALKYRKNARFRPFFGVKTDYLAELAQLTGMQIGVRDSLDRVVFEPSDRVSAENFVAWWDTHHTDFEWDERRLQFVNKNEITTKIEETDRLFRRLSATNDSIAMEAYRLLSEGDLGLVLEKMTQFRQAVRAFNPLLPSFKYRYLETLVQLTDYCRARNYSWKSTPKLDSILQILDDNPSPQTRYHAENQAVSSLNLSDATALEYLACLRERDVDFGFSVSRILDRLYALHWLEVRDDPAQLHFFLKKAVLYGQIGSVGVCNFYAQKLGWRPPVAVQITIDGKKNLNAERPAELLDPILKLAISQLLLQETDAEMEAFFLKILEVEPSVLRTELSWNRFFSIPESLTIKELQQLPAPSKATRKVFFKKIASEKSPTRAARYFDWLDARADLTWMPDLLQLLDVPARDSMQNKVAERASEVIEKLMETQLEGTKSAKILQWKAFQRDWKPDFEDWQRRFFELKLAQLQARDSLSIGEVNSVLQSTFFSPIYKNGVLGALPKVHPTSSIKRLSTLSKLQLPNDLTYFEQISFNYRDLDDLTRLFQTDNPAVFLSFFLRKSVDFDVTEMGVFLNELMRQDWLRSWINNLEAKNDRTKTLEANLRAYFESAELSQFEEQLTLFHLLLLENIGGSMRKKLEATFAMNVDPTTRGKLQQEILASISWEKIVEVAPLFEQLSPDENGRQPWSFLTTDFGLPPLNLAQNPDNQDFINLIKSKKQPEVIQIYLKKFGLDLPVFSEKTTRAEWNRVADWLAFDITTPFVGGGGARRDWYVYGVIKLLEDYFQTRLGFHEKVNDNQTFYTFNASKRAAAWLRFLKEKGLIDLKTGGFGAFVR